MKKLSLIYLLFLMGCSTSVDSYKDIKPVLNFEQFFNGKMIAHGYFKDRFNKVKKTFTVEMETVWNAEGVGTLTEYFTYNDGSKSTRVWTLKMNGENKVIGTAPDVFGEAHGTIAGNTLFWTYELNLEVDKKYYRVKFDDWMYLIDENNLLNQSYMSKFGINLGEVVLSIRKIK